FAAWPRARCRARAVGVGVEPRGGARWRRRRERRRAVERVAAADARGKPGDAEELRDREAADRDDQLRLKDRELPFAPKRAELLLARCRRAVAAPRSGASRIAAGDRRAVERRVELLFVQLEPAPQGLARAATPGAALLAFDDPGRLAVHVRDLACVHVADG